MRPGLPIFRQIIIIIMIEFLSNYWVIKTKTFIQCLTCEHYLKIVFKTSMLCLLIVIESANFGVLSPFFPISRNKFKSFESEIGGRDDLKWIFKY